MIVKYLKWLLILRKDALIKQLDDCDCRQAEEDYVCNVLLKNNQNWSCSSSAAIFVQFNLLFIIIFMSSYYNKTKPSKGIAK